MDMANRTDVNVQMGECFKCGKGAFHSMFSENCTKFTRPLAPEPCTKCKHGCHYPDDCLYQFEQNDTEETREEKTRRIKHDALENYYDHIGHLV